MKKLLFTLLVFAFVGSGIAFANSNTDPPDYEKTTLAEVASKNETITSLGWMPISVDTLSVSEGSFIFISYQQGIKDFGFASGIIVDYSNDGYLALKEKVFNCTLYRYKPIERKQMRKQINQNYLIGSAGGLPYTYNS